MFSPVPARPKTPQHRPRTVRRPLDVMRVFVCSILDARTVEVNLIEASSDQRQRYRGTEVVRTPGAVADQPNVLTRLLRRHVRCFIHGRDDDGHLLGVLVPIAAVR